MGRAPCCDKRGLKKGPWSPEEDRILLSYIEKNGHENWRALPELAGLLRCGKSCRLRWTNYLRPDIKRGSFTREEEWTIIQLQAIVGNRWSLIASQLPQRTDNEIKNLWNTKLKKRLFMMGLDPSTHAPKQEAKPTAPYGYEALAVTRHRTQLEKERREAEARILGESLVMASDSAAGYHTNNSTVETFTNPNGNPPADYFLKIWNSENGKAFRNKNHHLNGRVDSILSYEIPPSSVSSLCCVSTQRTCDQAFNQKYEDKDNGSQQFNSASFEWIRDFNVKFPEELSCVADMDPCQTEDKAAEELGPAQTVHYTGFPKLLLGFADHDDNNNNTSNIQSELSAGFQQQSASPWPEFHDEEYWSNMSFTACASANS